MALIWLSLVSSKTNRLRHGGLNSQTHIYALMPLNLCVNGSTHKYGSKHTHKNTITSHTPLRKDCKGYRWCALGLVTGALIELVLDPMWKLPLFTGLRG